VTSAAARGVPPRLGIEVWAAGYLLGRDVASVGPARTADPELLRAAVLTSIRAGMTGADRAPALRPALTELAAAGVARGRAAGPPDPDPLPAGAHPDHDVVARMAARDAAAHLLLSSYDVVVRLRTEVLACPWCGADRQEDRLEDRPWQPPLRGWEAGLDWAPESAGAPVPTVLGCERLTVRGLLALAVAAHRSPRLRAARFSSRAAEVVRRLGSRAARAPESAVLDALAGVDAAESWVDRLLAGEDPAGPGPLVVPGLTRAHPAEADRPDPAGTGAAFDSVAAPGLLLPHAHGRALAVLDRQYRAARFDAVRAALGTGTHPGYPDASLH
jgi:hypothetical protein